MSRVPQLSLKAYTHGTNLEKAQFVDRLFEGLKEYGFIVLRDHPIAVDLLHEAYALSEKLFAQPEAIKRAYIGREGGGQRGYTPFGTEHAKSSRYPDLKEFW